MSARRKASARGPVQIKQWLKAALNERPRLKRLALALLNGARYLFWRSRALLGRCLAWLRQGPEAAGAQALAAKGDWAGAVKAWRRLADAGAQLGPGDWTEYGRACLHARQLASAEAALGKALQLDPDATLALRLLGWTAIERRDWPGAAAHWQQALRKGVKGEELTEALRTLAMAFINAGRFAEAEPLLKRLAGIRRDGGAAQRLALELRGAMGELRLDDQQARAAWRELGRRFPQTARQIPAYLGFMGNEKIKAGDSKPAYTPEDLKRAKDAGSARLMLSYLAHLPKGEHIALMRQTVERFPPRSPEAAELHRLYLLTLCDNLLNAAELQELQKRTKAHAGQLREHPQGWLLLANAALTAGDAATVARLTEAASAQLGRHTEVQKLRLWLAAQNGDHHEAQAIAQELRQRDYLLAADNEGLDLRPLSPAPKASEWRRRQDRILLFTCLCNERGFVGWFLAHYRALGVEHFFIVDNLSNDGTAEYLCTQKDVTVFASRNSFRSTVSGMQWVNELRRRYGEDNWCVYVDADEELALPGDVTIANFVEGMAARGEEALPAYMLDTYPEDMAALRDFRPGDAPLAVSGLIDPDYFFFGGVNCCFLRVRGGVRERLFAIRDRIEKAPILRGGGGRIYRDNHHIHYARVSGQCAVLLHHKLLREALEMLHGEGSDWRIQSRLRQRQRLHGLYRSSGYLDPARGIPRGPEAVAYESPAQLQRLGLLGDMASLRRGG